MNEEELLERIAQLEFQNDQLAAEMQYVDRLLKKIGFIDGLQSVKAAAQELAGGDEWEERRFEEGLPDEPPGLD